MVAPCCRPLVGSAVYAGGAGGRMVGSGREGRRRCWTRERSRCEQLWAVLLIWAVLAVNLLVLCAATLCTTTPASYFSPC